MHDHAKHMEFHERSRAAMERLKLSARSCIPANWQTAILELDVSGRPEWGVRAIRHKLANPATGEEVEDLPETLFESATELHSIFTHYDQCWNRCVVSFEFDALGGFLRVESKYTYP